MEIPRRVPPLPENLWQKDDSLRRAASLMDRLGGSLKAVSFDFFDTLVWRLVTRPVDVFSEVGARLHQQGALKPAILPQDFETLRRHAEYKTRERQQIADPQREDITLPEIYDNLRNVLKDAPAAAELEHAIECELCQLNPGMAGFIEHVKQRGLKVLIISDIYFSAEQLRAILRANHLDPALFDLILTSADEGFCKGKGNLFKVALKQLGLTPDQMLHLGDNYHADVLGARKAGIRACHYPQASPDLCTILEREQVLLGGHPTVFNANSLRMLSARYFAQETDEDFFGRMGAFLLGPLMSRFATWACEQYLAAGARKVGAFMREGDLFAQVLQREADAKGYDLEIKPLFLNRKATDLAALGKLTAPGVIDWLERRCTLPIRGILKHFGLTADELRKLPLSLDEKADSKDKIIRLAEFLFTPAIARRIEEKSAEERRKVMDYLRPWRDAGGFLGVCDIGYSASAQAQLHRILELENDPTRVIGCYLVTYEKAADRVLEGMDIRHFLGAFGKPDFYFRTFLRSPAFLEQSLVAPLGTTLGYERQPDGTVTPVLDRMPFSPEMLRRQKAFKAGVLLFQNLWLACRENKPGLLDASSDFSRRLLADIDAAAQPTLGRVTAFPLNSELAHFGALPLDDYYFADAMKPMCAEKDRAALRKKGYAHLLGDAGTYWPQAVHALENPQGNSEFFSYAKALLLCNPERDGDGDGARADLTIFVRALRNPATLRECLGRLAAKNEAGLRLELVVGVPLGNQELHAVALEFSRQFTRFRIGDLLSREPLNLYLNGAADDSPAPFVLFLEEEAMLPAGWEKNLLAPLRNDPQTAAVLPRFEYSNGSTSEPSARCLLLRREAFIEGLGFKLDLSPDGATWHLLLQLSDLKWKINHCANVSVAVKAPLKNKSLSGGDLHFLKSCRADFAERIAAMTGDSASPLVSPAKAETDAATLPKCIQLDWAGTFLDRGSLSQVNRECLAALKKLDSHGLSVTGINTATNLAAKEKIPLEFKKLAETLSPAPSPDVQVTVRHQWPPNWTRPTRGALVVIQPWEFGALPVDWVKAAANVDEFWVPSDYVRQVYVNSGVSAHKVSVVPNGVDTAHFNRQAKPLKLATAKKFRFLFVGGTISRKGPDVLLKAYLEAFTAADDVCLVIKDFGGQSVYQGQTFEKQILAARLRPNAPEILYLNEEFPCEQMPQLYAACHCLVHPYRGEGFGLPVLEAMACGLPVIVTRGGSTDDFVSAECGWFISAQRQSLGRMIGTIPLVADGWWLEPDAADLGEKLKHAFVHPEDCAKLGRRGAEIAVENYSWERVAEKIQERLRHLASLAKPAAPKPTPLVKLELPAAALLGHLGAAREALRQKRFMAAWELAEAARQARPFNPEAWLVFSEIAAAAGDLPKAKQCLERAVQLAPQWKPLAQAAKNLRRHAPRLAIALPDLAESAKPRLTVCLIAKNEEQFLERCLASIREVATQIVLVDTGSTDRTVEIAKKFNAEVHFFPWNDDFSEARNEALKHATGDWILSLDADEELLPEHRATIWAEMLAPKVMGYRLPIIDQGREQEGCSYVPRLFRNAPGLFFVGRVHEQIFSSLEVRAREWHLENTLGKSALLHHGYVKEVVISRDKIARNLRLLELAVAELPGEPNLVMNQGLELIRSGQLNAGLEKYQEAISLMTAMPASQIVPELRETLLTQFATHLLNAKRFAEIEQLFNGKLAKSAGLTASQHFLLGLAHLELKHPSQVVEQMRHCLAKRDQPTLSPCNAEIHKAGPNHCLALSLMALQNETEAQAAFQAALKDDPQSQIARLDYAKFHFQQSRPVEALQLLNQLAAENPAEAPIWLLGGQIALSQPDFADFALNWTAEAMKHFPEHPAVVLQRAEILLLNQQTAEALPLWQKSHSPKSARHLAALALCEFITGKCPRQFGAADEKVVSQEFLKWYRQLIKQGGASLVNQINENLDDLRVTLPSAAQVLTAALKQASAAMAV